MATTTGERTESRWGPFPLDGRRFGILMGAYLALVGLFWAAGTVVVGLGDTRLGSLDRDLARWMADQRTTVLNTLTDIGSGFSDTLTVVIALVVLAIIFTAAWRQWGEATTLLVALGLEVATFVTTAYLVGRDRPPVARVDPAPPTSSFPSGHVAAAVALYWGLAYIVYRHTENTLARVAAAVLAVAAPVAVALSRMYRGMHYLTDVIAGGLLGAACLAIAIAVVRQGLAERRAHEELVA